MNYQKSDITISEEVIKFADQMPLPVVISRKENPASILFINRAGHNLMKEIFGSEDEFEDQAQNRTGIIAQIIEKNDILKNYSHVRKTEKAIKNSFVTFKHCKTEYSVLTNISMIDSAGGEDRLFLTTIENISELFNYNRELHYSRKHLDGMIEAFARDRISYLLAYGQEETVRHLLEVRVFSKMIATSLMREYSRKKSSTSEYSKITPLYIKILELSALLHDFGKIKQDIQKIIMQPRKLTESEYNTVKTHTVLGAELIGKDNQILHMSWLVARYHHEKCDGSGYPEGLKGKDIPLSARIVAFADMYSALRNRRAYKDAISDTEEIKSIFMECRAHYDPVVFKAGMALIPKMQQKAEYIDKEYHDFELNTESLISLLKGISSP